MIDNIQIRKVHNRLYYVCYKGVFIESTHRLKDAKTLVSILSKSLQR
jgi:hypothetical protein